MTDLSRSNEASRRNRPWLIVCCALAWACLMRPATADASCGSYVHVRQAWAESLLASDSRAAGFPTPSDVPTSAPDLPCRGLDCRPSPPVAPAPPLGTTPGPRNEFGLVPVVAVGEIAFPVAPARNAAPTSPTSPSPDELLRPPRQGGV